MDNSISLQDMDQVEDLDVICMFPGKHWAPIIYSHLTCAVAKHAWGQWPCSSRPICPPVNAVCSLQGCKMGPSWSCWVINVSKGCDLTRLAPACMVLGARLSPSSLAAPYRDTALFFFFFAGIRPNISLPLILGSRLKSWDPLSTHPLKSAPNQCFSALQRSR